MRRAIALSVSVASLLSLLAGCSVVEGMGARNCPASRRLNPGQADRFDFVKVGGVTYHATQASGPLAGRELRGGDLGRRVAEVRCQLADSHTDPPVNFDGDAAFLAEGTALHAVRGYRPGFRLAARREGRLVLFEAVENPRARTWGDLLDLRGKVRAIRLYRDGPVRPAGAVTDPALLGHLVDLLLRAPLGRYNCPDGSLTLVFQFTDGTASVHGYHLHLGRMDCQAPLPQPFRAAMRAASG